MLVPHPAPTAEPPDGMSRRRFLTIGAGAGVGAASAATVGRYTAHHLRAVTADRARFTVPHRFRLHHRPRPAPRSRCRESPNSSPRTRFLPRRHGPSASRGEQRAVAAAHPRNGRPHCAVHDGRPPAAARGIADDDPDVSYRTKSAAISPAMPSDRLPAGGLLAEAGVHADADMLLSRSTDGFTAGTPIEAVTDGRDALSPSE